MEPLTLALLAAAGFAGGFINAAVGLRDPASSYPALLAVGIPPVAANGTNTAGLSPGSFSSAWAYRPSSGTAWPGCAGRSSPTVVGRGARRDPRRRAAQPRLHLRSCRGWSALATVLVAVQPVLARTVRAHRAGQPRRVWPWTGLIGIYGGYFGAAQGVMLMAALGLVYDPDTQRSNAAKNILAAAANVTAAVVFALSGAVVWLAALAVAVGSIPGGYVGGRVARRLPGRSCGGWWS